MGVRVGKFCVLFGGGFLHIINSYILVFIQSIILNSLFFYGIYLSDVFLENLPVFPFLL